MFPRTQDMLKREFGHFSDYFQALEFLLPQGRYIRVEILRQCPPAFFGFTDVHLGVWPVTPNTKKQASWISLDDFILEWGPRVVKRGRK